MSGLNERECDLGSLVEQTIARNNLGLRGYIAKIELPYADQNAMADVEGRPRSVRNYGGIERSPNFAWYRGHDVLTVPSET